MKQKRSRLLMLFLLVQITFVVSNCTNELPYDNPKIPTPLMPKTRSIILSVLKELRTDSLFKELVHLSDPTKFKHDRDSLKLIYGDDIALLDSIYLNHNELRFAETLNYYRSHRGKYCEDFLYYVLYEAGSFTKTRTLDDIYIEGEVSLYTPEFISSKLEGLLKLFLLFSN